MFIRLFYLYKSAGQLLPIYPVYLLMFQQQGLPISSISFLLIIWSIPGFILEVPSSILADRWNRKMLLFYGRLLKCLCFAVWGIWGSFAGFAIGFLFWGAGGALCSGTEEAWLFDALKAHQMDSEFDRIWGRSSFYAQMSVGIAFVAGSIIAAHSMQLAIWLSVAMTAISAVTALLLPEYNEHMQLQSRQGLHNYLVTLKEGIAFCLQNRLITVLVFINITVIITAGVLDEYDQLVVRSMGVPFALVGLWGFSRFTTEALGGRLAWRVKLFLGRKGITGPIPTQLVIGFAAGMMLLMTAGFPVIMILPLYIMYYFLLAVGKVLFTDTLQSEIQTQGRATVQSLSAMLETPSAILIYALFGAASEFGQLRGALFAVSVWIFIFCSLFVMLARKLMFHGSTK